jgi:hypothetical protein
MELVGAKLGLYSILINEVELENLNTVCSIFSIIENSNNYLLALQIVTLDYH